jgi:hypothetical protein
MFAFCQNITYLKLDGSMAGLHIQNSKLDVAFRLETASFQMKLSVWKQLVSK